MCLAAMTALGWQLVAFPVQDRHACMLDSSPMAVTQCGVPLSDTVRCPGECCSVAPAGACLQLVAALLLWLVEPSKGYLPLAPGPCKGRQAQGLVGPVAHAWHQAPASAIRMLLAGHEVCG